LLKISLLRALGSQAGITKIELKGNSVMFYPEQFDLPVWIALGKKNFSVQVIPGKTPCISMKVEKSLSLEMTSEALKLYIKLQENKT
jgi:hypothetical protein